MTTGEIGERLRAGKIVVLDEARWGALAGGFALAEEHDTGVAGPLLVVRRGELWAAVERPRPGERVVRPLPDAAAVRAFVRDRLAAYERMWDG